MRKIEFIPGILAMRGNLSGNQKVGYPLQGGAAYDAPEGINHATSYRASYIGAKRAKDGLTYFAVKTKQTVNITPESRLKWAVLAACSIIYGESLKIGNGTFKAQMYRVYQSFKEANPTSARAKSMRGYYYSGIQQMVLSGDVKTRFDETATGGASAFIDIDNIFALDKGDVPVIETAKFIKFGELVWAMSDERVGGKLFTINSIVKGAPATVEGSDPTWSSLFSDDVFDNPNWDAIKDGIAVHNTQNACVTYQNHVLYLGDTKVLPTDTLVAGAKYVTKEAYSA